jgi:alpha-L-fucosidase
VGRNSKLLLNVPPNRAGVIPAPDVQRLREFKRARDRLFARERRSVTWKWTNGPGLRHEGLASLARPLNLAVIRLGEAIENGQQVARYRVEGDVGNGQWRVLSSGETIGYCKLDRLDAPVTVSRVRVIIDDVVDAVPTVNVRLFAAVT